MTISSFKIYTKSIPNIPLSSKADKKVYNLTSEFDTTVKPPFINNFNKDTFLKENLSDKGEVKFPKGLWEFHLAFQYTIANLNASVPIPSSALCSIDFNLKVLLDGKEVNDRPRMMASGISTGVINWTFQIPIEKDNTLLKLEIEPQAWQHNKEAQAPIPLIVNYACSLENITLIGEQKIVYPK